MSTVQMSLGILKQKVRTPEEKEKLILQHNASSMNY
jgi:hypothetical protein